MRVVAVVDIVVVVLSVWLHLMGLDVCGVRLQIQFVRNASHFSLQMNWNTSATRETRKKKTLSVFLHVFMRCAFCERKRRQVQERQKRAKCKAT